MPAMFTTYAYYNSDKFAFYGEELMKRSMAYRTMLDAGIVRRGGFGFQPGPVRAADGHSGHGDAHGLGRQDVGRESAHHAWTRRSASTRSTARTPRTKRRSRGRSRAGKLADFVVLADDPHTVSRRTRSRTSRSCRRWSGVRPSIRHRIASRPVQMDSFWEKDLWDFGDRGDNYGRTRSRSIPPIPKIPQILFSKLSNSTSAKRRIVRMAKPGDT